LIDKESLSWNDALKSCVTKGATLLKIDQDGQYDFSDTLFNFIKNYVENKNFIRSLWVS
jgi:hypothetical protein